ncbi:MAG: hypothetical protein H0T62_05730 [Parachlamydiaceae bacterium]|nr:hypothetical protein [Parachlamydiaceae bacterium]
MRSIGFDSRKMVKHDDFCSCNLVNQKDGTILLLLHVDDRVFEAEIKNGDLEFKGDEKNIGRFQTSLSVFSDKKLFQPKQSLMKRLGFAKLEEAAKLPGTIIRDVMNMIFR